MAEIDVSERLPGQQENQGPPPTSRTLLTGEALYSTDIHGHVEGVSPDIDDTSTRHEVEVKVDQHGLVSMDIYTPRTLVNSIPLNSGVMPIGALDNFQVVPSNRRENVLCVIHQTSEGRPKHEYLIFRRREEMEDWLKRLNIAVFNNPGWRRTDPTPFNLQPNTDQTGRAASAVNPGCFTNLGPLPDNDQTSSRGDVSMHDVIEDEVIGNDVTERLPDRRSKSPVEDTFRFETDEVDDGDHTSTSDDGSGGLTSIADLGFDSGVVVPQLRVSSASHGGGVAHQHVPSVQVGNRSPSIWTVNIAGEVSQRARKRHDNTKSTREIFSQLRQETHGNELTVNIPVKDACLLKMFDYQGHTWVRNCSGSYGLYRGDLIGTINGDKVTSTQMFRDRIEAMTADIQVVQLTVGRLPQASLRMMRTLPNGEIAFSTEGTKVKWIDVESDDGLFRIVKCGNAYITNINGRFIPNGSTTAEVTAHLQNAGDEFFLVLHPKEFAEKLQ